mmetsp:Transcript_11398/g.35421  ORF Transcript_11398/g.35421 Transcript_11398/m.35421 type:complete len:227 (+) Transcript_11398:161-841(+)
MTEATEPAMSSRNTRHWRRSTSRRSTLTMNGLAEKRRMMRTSFCTACTSRGLGVRMYLTATYVSDVGSYSRYTSPKPPEPMSVGSSGITCAVFGFPEHAAHRSYLQMAQWNAPLMRRSRPPMDLWHSSHAHVACGLYVSGLAQMCASGCRRGHRFGSSFDMEDVWRCISIAEPSGVCVVSSSNTASCSGGIGSGFPSSPCGSSRVSMNWIREVSHTSSGLCRSAVR